MPERQPPLPRQHPQTRVLHADAVLGGAETSVSAPIHYSATFKARDAAEFAAMATEPRHASFYTRYGNPTHERVCRILAQLEETETALLTASGMGAISTTVLALVSAGDHVVAQSRHYIEHDQAVRGGAAAFWRRGQPGRTDRPGRVRAGAAAEHAACDARVAGQSDAAADRSARSGKPGARTRRADGCRQHVCVTP